MTKIIYLFMFFMMFTANAFAVSTIDVDLDDDSMVDDIYLDLAHDNNGVLQADGAGVVSVIDLSALYQPLNSKLTALAANTMISGVTSWSITTNANPYTLAAATDGYMINVTTITAHEDDLVLTIGETSTLANQFWYIGNVAANTLILSDSAAVVEVQGYIELEINNWVLLKRSVANDRWEVQSKAVTTLFLSAVNISAGTLEIPNDDSSGVTEVGQIFYDTDGWFRHMDPTGTTQYATHDLSYYSYVILQPDDADNTIVPFGLDNKTGTTMYIQRIWVESDVDNSGCTLVRNYYNVRTSSGTTIEGLYATVDGTGVYTQNITRGDIDENAIGPDYGIYVVHDATDIGDFKVTVEYYYDGNVD